jgi:hypothetical protein
VEEFDESSVTRQWVDLLQSVSVNRVAAASPFTASLLTLVAWASELV